MDNNEKLQKDVQDAIKLQPLTNESTIIPVTADGVTLIGTVQSDPPTPDAETAANNIDTKNAGAERMDDNDVVAKISDHKVTITGTVHSWTQKEEAERAAWKAPGAWTMENDLVVEYVEKS